MVDAESARAALSEIGERHEQVNAEAAAHRPPWWTTALTVLGFYLVLGGTDLAFPLPLLFFLAGLLLMGTGLWVGIQRSKTSGVRQRRGTVSPRNVAIGSVLLVAVFGSMVLSKVLLDDHVPERMISVYAAIPAALLFLGYLVWSWRVQFGSRRR